MKLQIRSRYYWNSYDVLEKYCKLPLNLQRPSYNDQWTKEKRCTTCKGRHSVVSYIQCSCGTLSFILVLMCTILGCYPWFLCVICKFLTCHFTSDQMTRQCTRITWVNIVNVNLTMNINKSLELLLDTNTLLKFLHNEYAFLLLDNLMENPSIVMLSMEPRKRIDTLHNIYCLTSYSISCRHFTWLQKCCNC